MTKTRVEDRVIEWVQPIAGELGLELVDVEFVKEGGHWFLRVYIDKETGVDLEDCQTVSRRLDDILEAEDPIPNSYSLEVSSPGLERPLKKDADFARFQGQRVRAATFAPIDGQKEFVGKLQGLENDVINLDQDGHIIALPREKVSKIHLFPLF